LNNKLSIEVLKINKNNFKLVLDVNQKVLPFYILTENYNKYFDIESVY